MPVTYKTININHHQGRQSSQFEQFYLLAVGIGHLMVRVGQPDKRVLLVTPGTNYLGVIFGANNHNLRIVINELLIIVAQLRQVRAAVRSGQATIEHQHHVLLSSKPRQRNGLSLNIYGRKIGSNFDWRVC